MVVDDKKIVLEVVEELSNTLSPYHPAPTPYSELEVELGLGSLERLELVRRLEQRLGRRIAERPVFKARYVNDLLVELADVTPNGPVTAKPRPIPPFPEQAETLLEALAYQAEQQPNEAAFVLLEQDREVALPTYSELLMQARRISAGLKALGVRPGDRVAVMLPTSVEFFEAFFGILNTGAIVVPLYPAARLDKFEDFLSRQDAILKNCQAEVLITLPQMAAITEVVRQRTRLSQITSCKSLKSSAPEPLYQALGDQVALMQYTSGSTGHPKGVPLTHQNLMVNMRAIAHGFGLDNNDVMVSWLPLYHDMGLIGMALTSFYYGNLLVLMAPDQFLSRPVRWLRAFSTYRGSMTAAPNFAYAICAKKIEESDLQGLDLSSWRIALNGAEPIVPSTVRAFEARFQQYGFKKSSTFPAYGLAEATLAVSFSPIGRGLKTLKVDREELTASGKVVVGHDEVPSCGFPVEDMEFRIADDTGPLPEGYQGHVELRGPSIMSGYYGLSPSQEWLRVGDLGFVQDGELYITGRSQDLIVVGGRNLHPNDLEAAVAELGGIRPGCVAAVGVESEGTQRLVILAETRKSSPQLRRAVQEKVMSFCSLPCEVVLLAPRTLLKTPSGKIRRQASKRLWQQGKLLPPKVRFSTIKQVVTGWAKAAPQFLSRGLRGAWCWGSLGQAWIELTLFRSPIQLVMQRLMKRLGIEIRIHGRPFGAGPVMVVANHASLLDGLILIAAWEGEPLRFVMGQQSVNHPLLAGLARDHLVVRRGVGEAQGALEKMTGALRDGACLAVFPEGGIEYSSGLRGFASGPFQACADSQARLQPVALAGSRTLLPQGQWVSYPGVVDLHFLDPRQAQEASFEAAAVLAREARAEIAEHLSEQCQEVRLSRRD